MTNIKTKFVFRIEFWKVRHETNFGAIFLDLALEAEKLLASLLPKKRQHDNRVKPKTNRVPLLITPPNYQNTVGEEKEKIEVAIKGFEIICKNCSSLVIKKSSKAKFCDDSCRWEYHKNKQQT